MQCANMNNKATALLTTTRTVGKAALILCLIMLMAGCVGTTTNIGVPGVIKIKQDEFSPGIQKYASSFFDIKNIEFGNPGFSIGRLLWGKSKNTEIRCIETTYCGKSWLFVKKIKFLIDGEIFEYSSESNPVREVNSSGVEEENIFIVPEELFTRILYANSVSVRLAGSHYYVGKVIDTDELELIKNFIRYTNTL